MCLVLILLIVDFVITSLVISYAVVIQIILDFSLWENRVEFGESD
jgi:hypothetical protein